MFGAATDAAIDVIRTSRSSLEASADCIWVDPALVAARSIARPETGVLTNALWSAASAVSDRAYSCRHPHCSDPCGSNLVSCDNAGDYLRSQRQARHKVRKILQLGDWAHSPPRGCGAQPLTSARTPRPRPHRPSTDKPRERSIPAGPSPRPPPAKRRDKPRRAPSAKGA
jgi:hypothetical protein